MKKEKAKGMDRDEERRGRKRSRSDFSLKRHQQKSVCFYLHDSVGSKLYCVTTDDEVHSKKVSSVVEDSGDHELCNRSKLQVFSPPDTGVYPRGSPMVVSVGSIVYVLGGEYLTSKGKSRVSRRVVYLDTRWPNEGWKRGPSIINPRCNPRERGGKAIAVDGKIYVFGGNDHYQDKDKRDPWAECLDPNSPHKGWVPLCQPPDYVYGVDAVAVSEKRIFLTCSMASYVYHVTNNTWESSTYLLDANGLGVGNILYSTKVSWMYCWDVATKKKYCGRWEKYEPENISYEGSGYYNEPKLLHLNGNKFFGIQMNPMTGNTYKVVCTKFEVSELLENPTSIEREGCLKAAVISRNTFYIEGEEPRWGWDAFLVDGIPRWTGDVEEINSWE